MSTALRWLSRLLLVLFVLLAVLAAVWAYGRMSSPTAEQQAAIAVMQAEPPKIDGENGRPLLFSLPPAPEGGFPATLRCGDGVECIATIEAAPEANAAVISAWRPRLEQAARALHAPVFRETRDVVSYAEAMPAFSDTTNLDSLRAFDFATGQTDAALDAACTDAKAAIRWATHPDSLIEAMIGIAIFRQHSALIADMRRRAPGDALPASCAALAEPPDAAVEGTLCGAMRGEWRFQQRTLPSLEDMAANEGDSPWPRQLTPLLHDTEWMLGQSARSFATACGEAASEAARADRAVPLATPEPRWVDHVAFPVSVLLAEIGSAGYTDYAERQLDFVAYRRLLTAFLQMDAMDAALTPAQRFDALPETLKAGPRPLRFDAAIGQLSVPLRGRQAGQQGGEAVLSLPAAPPEA